jgi:hypothetical protein
LEGSAFDNFINAMKAKHTQKLYTAGLKKFMKFKQIEKVGDLLAWDPKIVEANIVSWIVHMKRDERLAPISVEAYLASVLFFYTINDIELKRKKLGRYLPEDRKVNDDRALHFPRNCQAFGVLRRKDKGVGFAFSFKWHEGWSYFRVAAKSPSKNRKIPSL